MPAKPNLHKNNSTRSACIKSYPDAPLSETITNGFFTVDATWIVLYWNRAAEIILKVAAKDIVGKDLWTAFNGVIPKELFAIDQRSFQKDVPIHFHEYWAEMGAWFDVITYHCDNTLSVSFKSSNHPHVENPEDPLTRLQSLTTLYRFVTEITNDCLWEWDLHAKEMFWIDGGHKRVFGYQVENALIPQSFWEQCIHPDDKKHLLTALQKIIEACSSSQWEAEYRFKCADGNYLYVHDRAHIIYDEDGKVSRMIGATQDITEKILLQNKLAMQSQTKQREITDAVLRSQEKERKTIAIELNENLNQLLVAAKWNIHLAKSDRFKMDTCLDNANDYLNNVIGEIKRIYKTLMIPDKDTFGLFENIQHLVEGLGKEHPLKFKFQESGIDEEEDLNKNMEEDIYRIVQEQLNNIINHAHATQVCIDLCRKNNKIILSVSDNGIGYERFSEKTGFGNISIKSRAELYDGTVTITSKPGHGYTLQVVIPCLT